MAANNPGLDLFSVPTKRSPNDLLERFGLAEYTYGTIKTIVCEACRVICPPNIVPGHLKKNHSFEHAEIKRSGLLMSVKKHRWASEDDINKFIATLVQRRPMPISPFQSLRGWQCQYCSKCYTTKDSLGNHISQRCLKRPSDSQARHITLQNCVDCQRILGNKHGTLVRIYSRLGKPPTIELGSKELEFLRNRRTQRSHTAGLDPTSRSDPWLARTGWLGFCGGDASFVASTLCPLSAARSRCPTIQRLAAATRSLLNKSLRYIGETSDFYRRNLESPGPHRYSNDLFGCQLETTQKAYLDIFVRLVLYICSLSRQGNFVIRKSGVVLDDFLDSIHTALSLVEGRDPAICASEIEKGILVLIVKCLTTKIPPGSSSRFQHPILNFLAVEGYDEKAGKWRDARHMTQYYASMSFCARLCILAWSWETAKSSQKLDAEVGRFCSESGREGWDENDEDAGDDDDDGAEEDETDGFLVKQASDRNRESAARKMVAHQFSHEFGEAVQATKDGLDYPMSEWMSQHAYGKAISDNSLSHGHIYWSGDEMTLFHNGERFDLVKYRGFMAAIPKKIEHLLQKMMFITGDLPIISLREIFDNTSDYTPGYGVHTEPRNSKLRNPCLFSRITKESELQDIYFPKGSQILCRKAMSTYLELHLELQLWFAVAVLLTSGAPPRGTEIITLLKENTATQRRNIFVVDGDVMILSAYNKTQGITGHASPIYRFLPKAIGEQLILYLFHVEPLADLFQHRFSSGSQSTTEKNAGPSPLLFAPFEKDYRSWKPLMISNFLKRETELSMHFPLQLSNYRQIIAAVTRMHIQDMADIIDRHLEQRQSKLIEQFGHCYRTNVSHYGVTDSRIQGTEEISMKQFRRASLHYQFFLGVIPTLPRWMYEPSAALYSLTNGESIPHPRFQHPAFPLVVEECPSQVQPVLEDGDTLNEDVDGVLYSGSFAVVI
ncbi:hypothetical protein TWF730_011357 [Orbilia blumenaviensis]|uniref:C2H2-type domain-containing protein n=1 Tax=Orbilia blumenaviensis TaxID=1796055 RepID=A0AAV9UMF7_9PEZI